MSAMISLLSFILALGVLVTVHEFGHFWVARRCGVKVLQFSVGFGKPLFRFKRQNDDTDYIIAAIPLGGYVKMLDENNAVVREADKGKAFNNQSLLKRVLIVLAGPLANFIFAFVMFWLILMLGEEGLKPVVGELNPKGLAVHAGVEVGDEIIEVNGRPAPIWRIALGMMTTEVLDSGQTDIALIKPGGQRINVTLELSASEMVEVDEISNLLGIEPRLPMIKPIIEHVVAGGAADLAGLEKGDLIIAVDQVSIETWSEWVTIIRANAGKKLELIVQTKAGQAGRFLTPASVNAGGQIIGQIKASAHVDKDELSEFYQHYRLGPIQALLEASHQTITYSTLTVKLIGRMIIGKASVENLSGPISLAKYAGQTASIGLISFLKFLAFVSLSLGVMNLMPIPMLDGGHLFFFLVEGLKGKPLSEKSQEALMRLGMILLFSIMALALFIDLNRILA